MQLPWVAEFVVTDDNILQRDYKQQVRPVELRKRCYKENERIFSCYK